MLTSNHQKTTNDFAALQPCNPATLQPCHSATLPPSNLTTLLLLCLLLVGCTNNKSAQLASASVVAAMSGPAAEGFARAYEPIEFEFPLDHGPHPNYQTEWWYYTGNLADDMAISLLSFAAH